MLPDRVLHLTLVHEGDLKVKINPADNQEEDEQDVRDRGVKIATYFTREQGVKLTHESISLLSLVSNQVRMRQLNEYILERRSTLS